MNTHEGHKPETETNIAPALVDRVSQRLAMGIPLKIALAGENVTCEEYEIHLSAHPDLAELEDVAKRKFLEHAMSVILKGKDASANFRWLVERVYGDVIGSEQEDEPEEEHQTIRGVPEYLLNEARKRALEVESNPPPYD